MLKKIFIILGLILIPSSLCAMQNGSEIVLDEVESDSLKKPLIQLKKSRKIGLDSHNQELDNQEESRSVSCSPNPLFCWNNLFSCWRDIGLHVEKVIKME